MATIRAYTTIEQSKVLAEILPLESADMYYSCGAVAPDVMIGSKRDYRCYTICLSLASLLGVLPSATLDSSNNHRYKLRCMERFTEWHDNPIDACYRMILKLHELKML